MKKTIKMPEVSLRFEARADVCQRTRHWRFDDEFRETVLCWRRYMKVGEDQTEDVYQQGEG